MIKYLIPLVFTSALTVATADTITVCLDGGCDYTEIQTAVNAANTGDVIKIAAGTYRPEGTIDASGKAITIRGSLNANGEPITIVDGQNERGLFQCIEGGDAVTVFENLVFTQGFAEGGGGLYCGVSSVVITNCIFTQNAVTSVNYAWGGGVYVFQGNATILSCSFINNSSVYSAGALGLYQSTLTIDDCLFRGNSVIEGGTQSQYGFGGAISCLESNMIVRNGLFENNSAVGLGIGGAVYTPLSVTSFSSCSFINNSALSSIFGYGGGIAGAGKDVTITECVFQGNIASSSGGGVSGLPSISGTTICGNLPDQVDDVFTDQGGNCIQDQCIDCEVADCPADLNQDGSVDGNDVGLFFVEWGCATPLPCPADLNQDGIVNGNDLGLLFVEWGMCN